MEQHIMQEKTNAELVKLNKDYNVLNNKVNLLQAESINNFYLDKFREFVTSFDTWKICKQFIKTRKNKNEAQSLELKINGTVVNDKEVISEHIVDNIFLKPNHDL